MKIKEQIDILTELGIIKVKNKLLNKQQALKDITKFTRMKFRHTNRDKIWEMLCSKPYNQKEYDEYKTYESFENRSAIWEMVGAFLLIPCLIVSVYSKSLLPIILAVLCFGYGLYMGYKSRDHFSKKIINFDENTRLRRPELKSMKLKHWEDNLPKGALYALKEAKDQGLCRFEIYYPAKQKIRLKQDPVIVGYTPKGKEMFEVFAWDDGKVYDGVLS